MEIIFCVYDSRYSQDPNKAQLLTVENTLKEAKKVMKEFGNGNVVVKETIEGTEITKTQIVYIDND